MNDGEEEERLAMWQFSFFSPPPKFFGGRFIQDVTAACVLVEAFGKVTAF